MTVIDIHDSQRRFERSIKNLENDKGISQKNKKYIKKLIFKKSHVTFLTKCRLIFSLRVVAKYLKKDFDKVRNGELHELFNKMIEGKIRKKDGERYSNVTINKCKKCTKEIFVKIIRRRKVVEDIKAKNKLKDLSVSKMWTREEMLDMPNYADNLRDKALVSMLILGCRISELGRLLLSDLEMHDEYIAINIRNSKTPHSTRTVYLYDNIVHITNYLDFHPLGKPDSPLFVRDNKPMAYDFLRWIIKKVARLVNKKKPCNTHNFRHSVALWKHKAGMHDLELNKSMGWALGSNMKARYAACDNQMVRDEELRIRGLKERVEVKEDKITRCSRCNMKYVNHDLEKNPHCSRCGNTMNNKLKIEESRKSMEKTNNRIKRMEEFMNFMMKAKDKKPFENLLTKNDINNVEKKQLKEELKVMVHNN